MTKTNYDIYLKGICSEIFKEQLLSTKSVITAFEKNHKESLKPIDTILENDNVNFEFLQNTFVSNPNQFKDICSKAITQLKPYTQSDKDVDDEIERLEKKKEKESQLENDRIKEESIKDAKNEKIERYLIYILIACLSIFYIILNKYRIDNTHNLDVIWYYILIIAQPIIFGFIGYSIFAYFEERLNIQKTNRKSNRLTTGIILLALLIFLYSINKDNFYIIDQPAEAIAETATAVPAIENSSNSNTNYQATDASIKNNSERINPFGEGKCKVIFNFNNPTVSGYSLFADSEFVMTIPDFTYEISQSAIIKSGNYQISIKNKNSETYWNGNIEALEGQEINYNF